MTSAFTHSQKIAECWRNGNSIGETRQAVKRCCNERVTFDEVRRCFVALAGERA